VSFPDVGDPQRVSLTRGGSPHWASSGDELFFWQDSILMVAAVRTEARFGVEDIQPLFTVSVESGDVANYDVAPDGERFLIRVRNPAALATEIQVVVNWFEELKERVPN
jgi:hypothetical protein